ncbi:MAG: hypothetical protein NC123_15535 [Butyrivibrio sp.]|nr:hypothetical protein [Acetatifactor muris]MCM1560931.1 hypothetical protein [Butyrivibrio sp.]
MRENTTIKAKIILEGEEEYKRKMSEVRVSMDELADSVDRLSAKMEKLNKSIQEFVELRKGLF